MSSRREDVAKEFTAKGRATRNRIVDEATGLVYEKGVANTSLQDVQRAACVSGSQMYHYFPDKTLLVHAVVDRQRELLLGAQAKLLDHLDSLQGIRAWRDHAVRTARRLRARGGCPLGSLASELSDHDPVARADLAEAFQLWAGLFRDGLRAMQDRGELSAEADPEQLGYGLLAAAEGGLLIGKAMRDTAPLELALDAVIDRIASLAA
jgi:TetR/AcrR family transcriptional regulator, transcriptional repressor for nem operon